MMKWGRKKTIPPPFTSSSSTPSPAPRPHVISHVFPLSWLSKFKQKSSHSGPKPIKGTPQGNWNTSLPSTNPPKIAALATETVASSGLGSFYDDTFWSLSFRKDNSSVEKKKKNRNKKTMKKPSNVCLKSVWYDEREVPFSNCPNCRGKDAEDEICETKENRRVLELRREFGTREMETTTPKRTSTGRDGNLRLKTIEEAVNLEECEEEKMSFDWRKLRELKIDKIEKQRKSVHVSRECGLDEIQDQKKRPKPKQSRGKMRAYSPRTLSRIETCKVKALEDMKKAKLKMKMKMDRKVISTRVQSTTGGLESFAVVKCSYDPHKDFKESMVEMIMEKKITQPEEFEELLACYLTLNSDEYHDVIMKVFRQVWFDLGFELKSDQILFSD
ncbi:hypothetical protein CsatA_023227 [Cannabis sativa]